MRSFHLPTNSPGKDAKIFPCALRLLTPALSSFGEERGKAVAAFTVQWFNVRIIQRILICLIVAVALVLRAQTTSTPLVETNTPTVVRTNVPTEIRPTEIHSEAARFYMKSNIFVYIGDVHVDNPQMQLWSKLLTLEAPKMAHDEKFNRGTAETNVVIDFVTGTAPNQTTNHATCDKAVYTSIITNILPFPAQLWQTSSVVVLTGNPVVTNNQGVTKMDPLIWDRIADVIYSTNFKGMDINPQQTNNNSTFFETPAAKPATTYGRGK